jgi:glycosyltransferase involved in cell wall biosynthesis
MRILMLTNFAGDAIGGGETHLLRLLDGLRGRYETVVGCVEGSTIERLLVDAGHEVRPVRWSSALAAIRDVGAIARSERVDLVHAHGYFPGIIARLARRAGAPVVSTMHCAPDVALEARDDARTRRSVRVRGLVDNATAGRVCRMIAVSEMVAAKMRAQGFPADKLAVIHNGVPVAEVADRARASTYALHAAPEGTIWIGTVARLEASKNTRALIGAVPFLPPHVRCAIVGDGAERPALEALAISLGVADRIAFPGHTDDVPGALASLSALVVPVPLGGLNVTMLEAMAVGTPVVGVLGGAGEAIVDGESGLLVPTAEPALLAAAVTRLLDDAALRSRLVDNARTRVAAEFSVETMVARTEAVYALCARIA